MKPLLTPIIFCGPGSNLYPLCDASTSASTSSAKALLPLANRPMLAFALQSVLSAGLSYCIVLAPAAQHADIARALSGVKLVPPTIVPLSTSEKKRAAKETKEERAAMGQITFVDGTASSTGEGSAQGMRVELLPLGPHDAHMDVTTSSGKTGSSGAADKERFRRGPLGTAELLRWLGALGRLDTADPLVLSVDLVAPVFPLRSLIDVYVQAQAKQALSTPPTVCCALYERGAGEGVGRERERDGPPRLISAFSRSAHGAEEGSELVFLCDSDLNTDLDVRRSLLEHAPRTRISTRLLDAHAYIFNRKQVLPLLEANERLTSLRDHVVPLVAKASWMRGLGEKAGWPRSSLGVARGKRGTDDEGEESDDMLMLQQSFADLDATDDVGGQALQEAAIGRSTQTIAAKPDAEDGDPFLAAVRCLTVVVRLGEEEGSGATLPRFAARANTVATYLECNRWLLKAIHNGVADSPLVIPDIHDLAESAMTNTAGPSTGPSSAHPPPTPKSASTTTSEGPLVAPSAQISADSLVGYGVRVGERASIKRSIVGHRCEIGRGARLAGCILLDGARVGENCRLDNVICCASSTIGERSTLKDCDVGAGVSVAAETNIKNEKLIGDQGDEESEDEDEDEGEVNTAAAAA